MAVIANESFVIDRDKTTTARTLVLLIEQGLVVRQRDPHDRRSYQIRLTPAGDALQATLVPIARALLAQATTGIAAEQVAALQTLLAQVEANLAADPTTALAAEEG